MFKKKAGGCESMREKFMVYTSGNVKNDQTRKPPRPASTIILVRDNHHGLQTYLLKRSGKSRFFPDAYVFPGGVLDEDDMDFRFWKKHIDMDMEEVSRCFGGNNITAENVLGYCVAGIRETFEEAGVLIARNESLHSLEQACEWRQTGGLKSGWLKHLASSGLSLSLASLSPWSHWITPIAMKYRYNALFFIAIMPPGQSCSPDGIETVNGVWINPGEALAANMAGTSPLTPPTIATMYELLDYPHADLLKPGWRSRRWGKAKLPRMVQSKGGPVILEPWDPQYDDSSQDKDTKEFESPAYSVHEPFSRLYLHNGIWKPSRSS
jgi:8-oxo-dGTP pyrophosphatase MutT (NUDIX family)